MNYLFEITIFLIIAFIYLHVNYHFKTSDDYEIYELDELTKDKLNEVCDLRQPVVFYYDNPISGTCRFSKLSTETGGMDVKIRDISEIKDSDELYIPLTLHNSVKLLKGDNETKYISEKNGEFIKEVGLDKQFKMNDEFIKPYLSSSSEYDILSGSNGSYTPLRYNLNYRNYYYVTEGSVSIKLTPPNSGKYLTKEKDFENFEFRSPMNPWNVQKQYETEFSKLRFVEITLTPGMMFQIPPYWWYSMRFTPNTTVASFKYKTIMNTVSIAPLLFVHLLQSFNIKRKFMKTFFPKKVTNTVGNLDSKLLKDKSRNNNAKKEKIIESKKHAKKTREKTKMFDNEILPNNLIKPALNSDTLSPQLIKHNEIKKRTHPTNIKQTSPVNETAQVL